MEEEKIKCPYCKSTQITIANKGVNTGGAIGGAILAGGVGAILGGMSGNKTKLLCMSCGASYTPEERNEKELRNKTYVDNIAAYNKMTPDQKKSQNVFTCGILLMFLVAVIIFLIAFSM